MKPRMLALLVVAALPLMAFNCVTDSFTIALNLKPFTGTFRINPGGNTTYGGSFTIKPDTLYDSGSYVLDGASVYDIRVGTSGPQDLGPVAGNVNVNTTPGSPILLMHYAGKWTDFNTPQSLLNSPFITRNSAGVNLLIQSVVGNQTITFSIVGTETLTPVPAGCSIVSTAYVQAYGQNK
jgi:hypothetical protein